MTVDLVPSTDLAPSLPSRVVTVNVLDVQEGGWAAGQSVHFSLVGDVHVPADQRIVLGRKGVRVDLPEGRGQVRLPVWTSATGEWAVKVQPSWTPHPYFIRVPSGSGSVDLSQINPLVDVPPGLKEWLLTNASVSATEGAAWGASVSVAGGNAHFAFTFPPGGVAWAKAGITAGGSIDNLTGSANVGLYRIDSTSVTGTPVNKLGTLEVQYNSAAGRTIQIFTDADPSGVSQYVRLHSGGTWGAWTAFGWARGLVPSGTDFNSIRSPGAYPIQFANHPNQPAGSVGTLEVLRASNDYIQRFVTREPDPRIYLRAAATSTTWHPWQGPFTLGSVGSLEGRISQIELQAAVGAPRAALAPQTGTLTARPAGEIMTSMSADRTRGWNAYGSVLSETWDDGATWTPVPLSGSNPFAGSTIESVLPLDNGDLLVSAFRGSTNRRELWVSSGYPSGPATFTKTLDGRARSIKFTSAWSQSTHGRIVLVNEYGPKEGALWDGQEVIAGENARYTYLSMDYGRTWRTVFDLNTYLTGQMGRPNVNNQHLHGVAWDPWWDRIWITFGDNSGGNGSNGIVFSDDLGATWQTAHHYVGTTPPHQVVGILPMPRCVLFAGDMGPDIIRIDRSEGKKSGTYATPVAFDSSASGMHLCQAIYRADRVGDDAPALFGFSAEGAAAPTFVVATFDGFTFSEIWRDTVSQAAGFGARNIVGPTVRGQVILASNDQRVPGSFSEIKMKAPGY